LRSLQQTIGRLEKLASEGEARMVIDQLYKLVPTFRPLVDATGSWDRPQPRRDRLQRLRIADQSA
jgi:hypothetical protein